MRAGNILQLRGMAGTNYMAAARHGSSNTSVDARYLSIVDMSLFFKL